MVRATVSSPIGNLLLEGDGEALSRLHMVGAEQPAPPPRGGMFAAARTQLEAYFAGERTAFAAAPRAPRQRLRAARVGRPAGDSLR